LSFLNSPRIWPAAIILSLSLFVLFQISLVRMASAGFEGPDEVQYYKMGLEYSRELERQKHQRLNGWRLEVLEQQPLRCRILDRQGHALEGELSVRFKRPATQTQDQKGVATRQGEDFLVHWQPRTGQWIVDLDFQSKGQCFKRQLRWTMP
jgi:nitrogen fixation protein FixH